MNFWKGNENFGEEFKFMDWEFIFKGQKLQFMGKNWNFGVKIPFKEQKLSFMGWKINFFLVEIAILGRN